MKLEITCVMCGRNFPVTLPMDKKQSISPEAVKTAIENYDRKWKVQFNGDYVDVYCSKECAE